jgi:hypothetical protein
MVSPPEIVAYRLNTEAVFSVNYSLYLFLQPQRKAQASLLAIGLKRIVGREVDIAAHSKPSLSPQTPNNYALSFADPLKRGITMRTQDDDTAGLDSILPLEHSPASDGLPNDVTVQP